MDTRVALIGIIVEESESVEELNRLLHSYREYVIGRMGLPYARRDISVISVAVDAPENIISALTGKLGMIRGVQAKALYAKKGS